MKKFTLALSATVLLCLGRACFALAADLTDSTSDTTTNTPIFSLSGDAHLGTFTTKSHSENTETGSLRLQLQLEPVEDITLTGRGSLFKIFDSGYDYYLIDRLFLSWNDIAGSSCSLLAGRLPSMEGAPDHLRRGLDTPQGILANYMDIALDGAMFTLSYKGTLPGTVRLFYGSQFDLGYEDDDDSDVIQMGGGVMEDTDIYGINWDLFAKGNRLVTLQSFVFDNIYNLSTDATFPNPYELAMIDFGLNPADYGMNWNGMLDRQNMGDIYVTSLGYLDKLESLNFFINVAWSHTDPTGIDEMGMGLLSDSWNEPEARDGYSVYAGLRYDIEELHSKIGLEYNYASKYWVNFSQSGASAKLNTRGSVMEGYLIFSPPLPQPTADYIENLFIRLSYQYYWYDYSLAGSYVGTPTRLDDLADDPMYQFYNQDDEEYVLYLSLDLYF
ncbi:MAG: DUF3373 domain-containing protein [Proteobacteria bacterium]|nr:DUF3373 domain-containing protein [Pseudomonadota bacterium]MBU1639842.1 DUF3373 domain-containing protein [Pseudomonadota bacterium]